MSNMFQGQELFKNFRFIQKLQKQNKEFLDIPHLDFPNVTIWLYLVYFVCLSLSADRMLLYPYFHAYFLETKYSFT